MRTGEWGVSLLGCGDIPHSSPPTPAKQRFERVSACGQAAPLSFQRSGVKAPGIPGAMVSVRSLRQLSTIGNESGDGLGAQGLGTFAADQIALRPDPRKSHRIRPSRGSNRMTTTYSTLFPVGAVLSRVRTIAQMSKTNRTSPNRPLTSIAMSRPLDRNDTAPRPAC